MRFRVIELNGTNASKVVQKSSDLVVRCRRRKAGVVDEKIGLGDMRGREIITQEQSGDGSLNILVLSEGGGSQCC